MRLRARRIIALTVSIMFLSLMLPHSSLWHGAAPAEAQALTWNLCQEGNNFYCFETTVASKCGSGGTFTGTFSQVSADACLNQCQIRAGSGGQCTGVRKDTGTPDDGGGVPPQLPPSGGTSCQQCNFAAGEVWCADRNDHYRGRCAPAGERCAQTEFSYTRSCPVSSPWELCQQGSTPFIIGGAGTQPGRILVSAQCVLQGFGFGGYAPNMYPFYPATPPGLCNPGERVECLFATQQSGFGLGGAGGFGLGYGTLPGANVAPSGWTDPDELLNPPRAVPNTPVCENAKNATIKATLQQDSRVVGTKLVRAGDTLTVSGDVERLTSSCEAFQYECRPFREVGCELKNRILWASLDYKACPANFGDILHEEGARTNINWQLIAAITVAVLGGFGVIPIEGLRVWIQSAGAAGCWPPQQQPQAGTGGSFDTRSAVLGAALGGCIGSAIDRAEQGAPEPCFRICGGDVTTTDPSPTPVCSGGRASVSVIGAHNTTASCGPLSCGAFAAKDVRIRIFDPNGALVKEDFTTTDAEGAFSYTFRAPPGDGEFTAIASVPIE